MDMELRNKIANGGDVDFISLMHAFHHLFQSRDASSMMSRRSDFIEIMKFNLRIRRLGYDKQPREALIVRQADLNAVMPRRR